MKWLKIAYSISVIAFGGVFVSFAFGNELMCKICVTVLFIFAFPIILRGILRNMYQMKGDNK